MPEHVVTEIKNICGGSVTPDSWRKDHCLGEIEPFRESECVHPHNVFHRLPIWLILLPWQKSLVPCLYASIDYRVDEFQIDQSVKDDTYFPYTNTTSPCFVDRIGNRIDDDAVYFCGDEDAEDWLYICPLKAGINVIGSGVDEEVSNFMADVMDPWSIDEMPQWLHAHPVQQLLKLTVDSNVATAFALAPRRFAKLDSHWTGDGETKFRPAFSDSFAKGTQLGQDTIGAYLLRNFAFAEDNTIFEAL